MKGVAGPRTHQAQRGADHLAGAAKVTLRDPAIDERLELGRKGYVAGFATDHAPISGPGSPLCRPLMQAVQRTIAKSGIWRLPEKAMLARSQWLARPLQLHAAPRLRRCVRRQPGRESRHRCRAT